MARCVHYPRRAWPIQDLAVDELRDLPESGLAGGLRFSRVTRRSAGRPGSLGVSSGAVGGDGVPVAGTAVLSARLDVVGAGAPSAPLGARVVSVPGSGWHGGKRGEVVIQYRQRPPV